jgi:hypothetical protein
VGKRSRRRAASTAEATPDLTAAPVDYTDPEGNTLTLRTSFTAAARREYAQTLSGVRGSPSATREDTWQRATELLFERLAVRWTIAGAPIERPRELLMRYRAASTQERAWIRDTLRSHCDEHFPDVSTP